jgi:hypothetical protein
MGAPHEPAHHIRTVQAERRHNRRVFYEFPYTGQERPATRAAGGRPDLGPGVRPLRAAPPLSTANGMSVLYRAGAASPSSWATRAPRSASIFVK